jgi:U2-associated protein SR140
MPEIPALTRASCPTYRDRLWTDKRTAYSGPTGSYALDDETTTNIHVSNLPQTVSDLALGDLFARMGGPVGSVKIMWPRLEGVPCNNLGGFVAMMKRADAERAFEAIDNLDWGGSVLHCSWGKAMPIPHRPAYGAQVSVSHPPPVVQQLGTVSSERRRSKSRSRSRSPKRTRHRSRSPSRSPSPRQWPELSNEDERFVTAIADKIKDHGPRFENTLKDRERGNPRFSFLEDDKVRRHRTSLQRD